ncbi:MAG: 3-hydroxyacyl-CoA dehydrogenase family protein [Bacteroidales bacterium]|jgi:3-hydroxybutyryl-CoA dehydrogenase
MSEIIGEIKDLLQQQKTNDVDTISKIGFIGTSRISCEIIKTASKSGFEVLAYNKTEGESNKILSTITEMLDDEIKGWGMTESEKRLILSRISVTNHMYDLSESDIVIESIDNYRKGTTLENRRNVLKDIENVVRNNTVLISNSSTIMVSELASVLTNPSRLIGIHFISPISTANIVELVRSQYTDDKCYEYALRFLKMLGKEAIEIAECPGNVSSRMNCIIINNACEILMEGLATIENIDEIMKVSMGSQYGPFELADKIGLNKLQRQMDNLYEEFGVQIFKCSSIIRRLVRSGKLGKESGQGFYKYDSTGKIIGTSVTFSEIA